MPTPSTKRITNHMPSSFAALLLSLLLCAPAPIAVADDMNTFDNRRDSFITSIAARGLNQGPNPNTWVDAERWSVAHANLVRNERLDEANQYFAQVQWVNMFGLDLISDTDIQVTDLLRTWFEFKDDSRLSKPARDHLKSMLSQWRVPNTDRNRDADKAYVWPHTYTENHSLNIVVATYLIDVAMERDRTASGALVKQFLDDRAKWGWSEFLSTRYGMVTAKTLTLLADFAPDHAIKLAGQAHLDLLIIDYATHSLDYWRGVPSARGDVNVGDNRRNAIIDLVRLWFGDPNPNAKFAGGTFILHFLTSSYRPPEIAEAIYHNPAKRGRVQATAVATTGPQKHRIPMRFWVTPVATIASAQGFGHFYRGAFTSISFASAPTNVITSAYGQEYNAFQHQQTIATFGEVKWHGALNPEQVAGVTVGNDDAVYVGQLDLGDDAHLLTVEPAAKFADKAAFAAAMNDLNADFTAGLLQWTMPEGDKVEMHNQPIAGGKWRFTQARVNDVPVRIDRNMLFDSPHHRSVRGSRVVDVVFGDMKRTYDLRNIDRPTITDAKNSAAAPLPPLPPNESPGPLDMTLCYIPAGEFPMGAPLTEGRADEQPMRWITLDAYHISQTEITVGQWKQYLAANPNAREPGDEYWRWGFDLGTRFKKKDRENDYAMTGISYDEAVMFCRWLSKTTGDDYRLPTEAQWEKAAKGYAHRPYPWGDRYDGTQAGSPNETYLPVGSQPDDRSVFGVLDMAGNVFEWCSDNYSATAYDDNTLVNPRGPAAGAERVLRGCGWNYDPDTFRITYRSSFPPNQRAVHIGFRVVKVISSE